MSTPAVETTTLHALSQYTNSWWFQLSTIAEGLTLLHCLRYVCLSVCLSVCPSVSLSACLSARLSVYLLVYLCMWLCMYDLEFIGGAKTGNDLQEA